MILIDVNVLVYAKRLDAPRHGEFRGWLRETLQSVSVFGMSEVVLSGVVRILTHPQIFQAPTPLTEALEYVNSFREYPGFVVVSSGVRHWEIFCELCKVAGAKGNLISDAYFAALAIESNSEWITTDRDFSRFPGLKWRHPIA